MNKNRVWFIADTHFGHWNIVKYCNRPFESVEDMERVLIHNWNSKIRKDDKVFMLGDFALCGKADIVRIGRQLNGRKTLVFGNHDGASKNTYYEAGFEYVSKYPIVYNDYFILSHEPPKFMSENTPYAYIYGHVHDSEMYSTVTKRSCCVCVERWNYSPISFSQIYERMEKM